MRTDGSKYFKTSSCTSFPLKNLILSRVLGPTNRLTTCRDAMKTVPSPNRFGNAHRSVAAAASRMTGKPRKRAFQRAQKIVGGSANQMCAQRSTKRAWIMSKHATRACG